MRRIPPSSLLRHRAIPTPVPITPTPLLALAAHFTCSVRFASGSSATPSITTDSPEYDITPQLQAQYTYDSLRRTAPLKVRERRERWPIHKERSYVPLVDPEFRSGESTKKRLPLGFETEFEHYRALGIFPGPRENVARAEFLEAALNWRNRPRGFSWEIWNGESWSNKAEDVKIAFFMAESRANGHQITHPYVDNPLADVKELFRAGKITLNANHLDPKAVAREFGSNVVPSQVDVQFTPNNAKMLDPLVNWKLVAEETPTLKQDPDLWSRVRKPMTGYRIYLPNVSVVLRRNKTPIDEPYDPMVATFRIPLSMTKTDLKSYLKGLYDLDVTFVRTDIRVGRIVRDRKTGQRGRQKGFQHNYKRAVVGLKEPFHYPDDEEELRAIGWAMGKGDQYRDQHLAYIDRALGLTRTKEYRHESMARSFRIREDRKLEKLPRDDIKLTERQAMGRLVSAASCRH